MLISGVPESAQIKWIGEIGNGLRYNFVMGDLENPLGGIEDLPRPGEPARDAEYLAWRKTKITRALKAARAAPEDRISQREIWKQFGLES